MEAAVDRVMKTYRRSKPAAAERGALDSILVGPRPPACL
jgi:hypothetical protein